MAPPPSVPPRVPTSKIVVPELPVEFTPRPLLRQLLDQATAAQVVLVSAPAGSGKTLLLADWVRGGEGPETAWVSLDADDNDPQRLWWAVLTALYALPSTSSLARSAQAGAHPPEGDLVEAVTDVLAMRLELTPTLLLAVNLSNAASIPLSMLLQRAFFGQRGRWLSSVAGRFRWRVLGRAACSSRARPLRTPRART